MTLQESSPKKLEVLCSAAAAHVVGRLKDQLKVSCIMTAAQLSLNFCAAWTRRHEMIEMLAIVSCSTHRENSTPSRAFRVAPERIGRFRGCGGQSWPQYRGSLRCAWGALQRCGWSTGHHSCAPPQRRCPNPENHSHHPQSRLDYHSDW